jgi:hypothetical protein
MATDTTPTDDELDVLACEYEKRPKGAPSFDDLQHAVRQVRREDGVLAVEYDPAVATAVEELAAAEQLCCPTIGFAVTPAPVPTLRITARPGQLDIFEQFLTS